LPSKKFVSVRSLLPQNFGTLDKRFVIDDGCSTFYSRNVLGFVKTLYGEIPESAQVSTAIFAKQSMLIIFDSSRLMFGDE
jgi:hypothetical protein